MFLLKKEMAKKPSLKEFLIENDVYELTLEEIRKDHVRRDRLDFLDYKIKSVFNKESTVDISGLFEWGKTDQGHVFWSKLSSEYSKINRKWK